MKRKFNAHKLFTSEINRAYYDLMVYIEGKEPDCYVRHQNLQLTTYDWHHDLIERLERKHEAILKELETVKPKEVLNWANDIKKEIQSRGPYYWDASDHFFEAVLTSSLKNYIKDEDFQFVYENDVSKWVLYLTKLSETKNEVEHDLEILKKRKDILYGDVTSQETQIDKMKAYLKDLGDLKNAYDKKVSLENQIKEIEQKKKIVEAELNNVTVRNKLAGTIDDLTERIGLTKTVR